ncbi:MAG: MoxR family ATPase [Nanoarchaeota archaeon]|nr:MoxR family ATPase [Nanoarchaeota archaeon]
MDMANIGIDKYDVYIANQARGKFDEIQRMAIAYVNKQPIALEGDPGVGKNQAIKVISKALGKNTHRIRCTEEMMARDIIGGEKLTVEKSEMGDIATKSQFSPGKLLLGMKNNEIVILDEVNQLLPTVQKALNSALEDNGKTLSGLETAFDVKAGDDFGLFLTYNPNTGISNSDLESAVRDRCKIFYFENLPTELKTRIALIQSGKFTLDDFLTDNSMGVRGLQKPNGNLGFVEYKNGTWLEFGTENPAKRKDFIQPYLFFNREKAQDLHFNNEMKDEIYQVGKSIVKAVDRVSNFSTEGTSKIGEELGLDLDNLTRLNINPSSPRIINKIVNDYVLLRGQGYSTKDSSSEIVHSIIDFLIPSNERNLKIGENITLPSLVEMTCASNGLVTDTSMYKIKEIAYAAAKEGIIESLTKSGYTQNIATKIVNDFMQQK